MVGDDGAGAMGPFMFTWFDVGEGEEWWNFVKGPLMGAVYSADNTDQMHPIMESVSDPSD